jgi:transaldolase/glucose-6-phosphate isomerase
MNSLSYTLPPELDAALHTALQDWQQNDKTSRLWARDASLWTGSDEADWLGWLTIVQHSLDHLDEVQSFVHELNASDIRQVVLLGMGGSSMAPEVLRDTFGQQDGYAELFVLDSTDPGQISTVEAALDLEHTAFIVASKSGSTLEPNILMAWFYQRMVDTVGAEQAASHFIAITDPGSSLEQEAGKNGFRQLFHGVPEIGGRFSALSNFGVVPAAVIGIDCRRLLETTLEMVAACADSTEAAENPGVLLGCLLGVATNNGRDKLTLIASPQVASMGAWLEQLIAESTGKQGKGVLPLDGEPTGSPDVYGDDRVFVYLRMDKAADAEQDKAVEQLEQAGQPVIRINITEVYNLGQELFRWEIATAVTGALIDVNPFDQPDVEASKIETRKLMGAFESGDDLPGEVPLAEDGQLVLYADARNAAELGDLCGEAATVADYLRAHMSRIEAGDYVAFLAYLERNEPHTLAIQAMREQLRDARKVATCLGFGPRFLHSTGQYYKGGPNNGVFLQLSCDAMHELPVPFERYSFAMAEAAQGRGDFEVLAERGRRGLRIHLGRDVAAGLQRLAQLLA